MERWSAPGNRFCERALGAATTVISTRNATATAHGVSQGGMAASVREPAQATPPRTAFPLLRPAVITPLLTPPTFAPRAIAAATSAATGPRLLPTDQRALGPVASASDTATAPLAPDDPFYAVWTVKEPDSIVPPTGNDLRKWTVHQLRKQCAEYNITMKRTGKNDKKVSERDGRAAAINKYLRAKQTVIEGVDIENAQPAQALTSRCPVRLIDILFSDKYSAQLSKTGKCAERTQLDTGEVNEKEPFWVRVTVDFNTKTTDYNDLLIPDHSLFRTMDPSTNVPHDTGDLIKIWKRSVSKYNKADGYFRQSGTHESDIVSFCRGAADAASLHAWLQIKPSLLGFVNGGLRAEMQRDSIRRQRESSAQETRQAEDTRAGKEKRRVASTVKPVKKWQEEVATSVSKMAEFVMQLHAQPARPAQQQHTSSQPAATAHDSTDAILERLTRCHKLIHVTSTRLRKLQAEGDEDADLESSLSKYRVWAARLEAKLESDL